MTKLTAMLMELALRLVGDLLYRLAADALFTVLDIIPPMLQLLHCFTAAV